MPRQCNDEDGGSRERSSATGIDAPDTHMRIVDCLNPAVKWQFDMMAKGEADPKAGLVCLCRQ